MYNEAKLNIHMFDAIAGKESVTKFNRRMLDEMEQKGITGFVDKAGREWNIARYTEMLARTTVMNAKNESKLNELRLRGHDLVRVSSHGTICEKCKPWEGAVLSMSGESKKYPSVAEAREAGLFHPNCQHSTGLFIDLDEEEEDATEIIEPTEAVENDLQPEASLEISANRTPSAEDIKEYPG
ncbi:MAG: phage minor capsid protein, partial [Synergistaceae bacterium]|nr:phage minor capsid protein [Synergistaceae bacterium]